MSPHAAHAVGCFHKLSFHIVLHNVKIHFLYTVIVMLALIGWAGPRTAHLDVLVHS